MAPLNKQGVIKIIADFLAVEDNIESVISLCINRMKDTVDSIDVATLSSAEKAKIHDLTEERANLAARIDKLELANKSMSQTIRDLEHQVRISSTFSNLLERRVDDGDQYCCRLNLLIDGIPIKRGESPSSIRTTIWNEINRLGVDINKCEVDRAHRAEHPFYDRNGIKQQAVIVRFVSWSARDKLYQARKNSNLHMRPDMTDRRREVLHHARDKIAAHASSGSEKLIDFVGVDRNCRLFLRSVGGKLQNFSSELEFDQLHLALEDRALGHAEHLHDDWGRYDVDGVPPVAAAEIEVSAAAYAGLSADDTLHGGAPDDGAAVATVPASSHGSVAVSGMEHGDPAVVNNS